MRLNRVYLLLGLLFAFSITALGQFPQAASIIHDLHIIESTVLKEDRRILVNFPPDYAKTVKRYPVVYMLDGHVPQPEMMGGILGQQAWGGQIPEMILVSIQNTNRSRDLTPTDDGKGGTVGGADRFLRFIESEVIPLVERNYRTEPFRIFAGHSLGGLTVVYSFVSRPGLFNAYIAASPALHYDDDFVIKEAEKMFANNERIDRTIFLGLGDEPEYEKGWNRLHKLVKDKNPKGLEYEFRKFPQENHASVVLQAYYWGLRLIFNGWIPGKVDTLSQLEDHYKKLTKRFGYQIRIPEETLNLIGYQLLRGEKIEDAIRVFETNAENYPDSANVYDSLGEALEKNGSMKKAAENYQIAYRLAVKAGNQELAEIFKANLARVRSRIR